LDFLEKPFQTVLIVLKDQSDSDVFSASSYWEPKWFRSEWSGGGDSGLIRLRHDDSRRKSDACAMLGAPNYGGELSCLRWGGQLVQSG
jgi:hypothetical protein